jgi:hypothetical protein
MRFAERLARQVFLTIKRTIPPSCNAASSVPQQLPIIVEQHSNNVPRLLLIRFLLCGKEAQNGKIQTLAGRTTRIFLARLRQDRTRVTVGTWAEDKS